MNLSWIQVADPFTQMQEKNMKTSWLITGLIICFVSGAAAYVPTADNPLYYQQGPTPSEQREMDLANAWRQQQQAELTAKKAAELKASQAESLRQTEAKLNALNIEATDKALAATNAEIEVENLKKSFLAAKLQIPTDPWREIYGTQKYAMSADSRFVRFTGQIQESTPNGIRVFGHFGNSSEKPKVEYFVVNFPYHFGAGESVDPTKIYAALEDGNFSYVTEDGYAKFLPKLNYGKPCPRPQNADEVEAKSKQLTQAEESKIKEATITAITNKNDALTAKQALNDFLKKTEDDKKAQIEAQNAPRARALKSNQDEAAKGDPIGLQRMGERYRDGDGVPKDLDKARDYFEKAQKAGNFLVDDELKKLNQKAK